MGNKSLKDKRQGCFPVKEKCEEITKYLELGQCAICCEDMNTFGNGKYKPKWLVCSHVYHTGCIDEWFDRSSDCPLCGLDQHLGDMYIKQMQDSTLNGGTGLEFYRVYASEE